MIERYRKRGRVVRLERDVVIAIDEAGEAVEDGRRFSVKPLNERPAFDGPDDDVLALAHSIRTTVRPPVEIERLIVSAGIAEHEFGDQRWRERTARVHVALVHRQRRLRATLDLGAESCSAIALDDIATVAGALARTTGEMPGPKQGIVAPHVTAAILHRLFRVDGIALMQAAGGRDGKGAPIEEGIIDQPAFPNWYRPSYRVRPVPMPFNLRAATTTSDLRLAVPRIIVLLGTGGDGIRVLWDEGGSIFESTLPILAVRAVGPPVRWYPHGAGAFGSELLL